MTMSVGTFEDLQPHAGQPVDRNPLLGCNQCGQSHRWQDYWKSRMTERDRHPGRQLLCDDCLEYADLLHDRWTDNRQLSEFVDSRDMEDER